MAGFVQMAVGGDRALAQAFENLSKRQIKSISRRAVEKGGEHVRTQARRLVPVNPDREEGENLRDTLITKVKSYEKTGKAASIIGPASYRAPHKHLVEFGSRVAQRPAVDKNSPVPFRWARLGNRFVKIHHTGKMPAFHFLENALEKSKTEVRQTMVSTFRDSLMRAARKEARAVNRIAGKFTAAKFTKKDLKAIGSLG